MWVAAFACLVGAAFYGWIWSNPSPKASLITYSAVSPQRLDLVLEASNPTDNEVACVVRAFDLDGFDLGYAPIAIPAADGVQRVPFSMRTLSTANGAAVVGCAAPDAVSTLAQPNWRPGVTPPKQPWSP